MDLIKWLALGVGGYLLYNYLFGATAQNQAAVAAGEVIPTNTTPTINGNPIVLTTSGNDAVVGGNVPTSIPTNILIDAALMTGNSQVDPQVVNVLMSVYQWDYYRSMGHGNQSSSNPYGNNAISQSQYHALLNQQGLEGLIGLGSVLIEQSGLADGIFARAGKR